MRIPEYAMQRNIESSELAVKMYEDYDHWYFVIECLVDDVAHRYGVTRDVAASALQGFASGPFRWIQRYYDIEVGRTTMEDYQ
jgi:hypothetical protein